MAIQFNRITEKTEAESVSTEAHVLITQPELIDGVATVSLRRAPMDLFAAAALKAMGLTIVDGALCAILANE